MPLSPRLRPRRLLGIVAALVVVLLLGSGVYARIRSAAQANESVASAPAAALGSASEAFATDVAIPVEVAEVVRETLVLAVSAAGQAAAWQQAVITAQVGGRVAAVAVRENAGVAAERVLLEIDPAEYQLAVDDAEARIRSAQAQYQELVLGAVEDPEVRATRERFARAKSGLEQAEVALRRARLDLDRTRVSAPFAGRVASIRVVPGQWVRPGDELMTVLDLDPIKVEVQVLESEIGYLSAGRRASVTFAAYPGESFTGRVETINPLVESGTRTAKVTVLLPNPEGRVLPGMYARVALDARRYPDRVLVPRSATLERDRRSMLFVYEGGDRGGLAKWRYVTTGLSNDSLVEIVPHPETDSVAPGERVLTNGHYTLIHDARVRLVDDVERAGGRPR